MRRFIGCTIAVLAVLVIAASVSAQVDAVGMQGPMYPQGSIMALDRQQRLLMSQLEQLHTEVSAAEQNLRATEQRVGSGQGTPSELSAAELDLQRARAQFEQTEITYTYMRLLYSLAQPVDIALKSADIRKAAEALSKISSVKITVDKAVPNDVFVTTDAEGVPLAGVLEVIADSAGLLIEPSDSGVKLSKPAKFTANGKTVTYDYANWPWSDQWSFGGRGGGGGVIPAGRRWLGLFDFAQQPAPSGLPVPVSAGSSVVLAGVGSNTLVVAEPGVGPQGEPGFWLTLYQLEKNRFVAGGKTFHRSSSGPTITKPVSGGGGGGGGGK